jgi:hypothetical protein
LRNNAWTFSVTVIRWRPIQKNDGVGAISFKKSIQKNDGVGAISFEKDFSFNCLEMHIQELYFF